MYQRLISPLLTFLVLLQLLHIFSRRIALVQEMFKSTGDSERAHPNHGYEIRIRATGLSKYPAKQHAQSVVRHAKLVEGLIYLLGQKEVYFEDSDMTYPFRQRRYFYYLSGVNEPGCYLTYDIERDYLTLYIPPIIPRTVVWVGRGSTLDEAKDKYDVDAVRLTTSLSDDICHWINHPPNHQRKFYVLHKDQIPHPLPLSDLPLDVDTWTLINAINESRVLKSHEISLIRHAIKISSIAHRSVLHHITSLKSEAEIHALFLDTCISYGAKSQAYAPIVASGTNASTLHYTKNDELLKGRGLVCMDAGCEWECYSSDITRTFPIHENGWVSRETQNIYQIVEEMQERCIEQLKPGIRYLDLHALAHRIAAKGLIRLGIFKNWVNVDLVIDTGVSKAFFPHRLGHHMGLEVHDVSGEPLLGFDQDSRQHSLYKQVEKNEYLDARDYVCDLCCGSHNDKRSTLLCAVDAGLLKESMVLTVEPGIYFSPYALQEIYLPDPAFAEMVDREILDRYMHVGGVRIEDDILITAKGHENLTLAPKGREMLEIIRDGAKCKHRDDCCLRSRTNQGCKMG